MYKNDLIRELKKLAINYGLTQYGDIYILPNENTNSSIIFKNIAYNFHPKSWAGINKNELYKKRTEKTHPKTITGEIFEMQSSNSSDALAMNIFCFPKFSSCKGSQKLFGVKEFDSIVFGHKSKVKKYKGKSIINDKTEVDIFLNNSIIIECKLTEDDFKKKSKEEVEKYKEFENVFHKEKLIQNEDKYFNYQLIRNILSAHQINGRFLLVCDMRRPDLVKSFYQTVRCVKDEYLTLRLNCDIIFWQDISKVVGKELKDFLKVKYGI